MLYSLTTEKLEELHKTILMEQKKNTFYSDVSTDILNISNLSVIIHQYSFPSPGRRSKDCLIFTTVI